MKLTGYADPLAVAPGEQLKVMVSAEAPEYHAAIVRLIHGDENPKGPGLKSEPIAAVVEGNYPGRQQPLHTGSYIEAPPNPKFDARSGFTLTAWLWPTTPTNGVQPVLTKWDGEHGYGLFIDENGATALWLSDTNGPRRLSSDKPLRRQQWYFVAIAYDPTTGAATLIQDPISEWPLEESRAAVSATLAGDVPQTDAPFLISAHANGRNAAPAALYNGKIEAPTLFARALTPAEIEVVKHGGWRVVGAPVTAAWNFARDFEGEHASDESNNALHGRVVNMPARAMSGHNWSGHETNFARAPAQYGAIHFHEDDLEDAHWDVDFTWTIPTELRSGVYAVHTSAAGARDYIPFYVRPPRGQATANIAFLAPTASYLAYANDRLVGGPKVLFTNQDPTLNKEAYDYCFANNLLSTYDLHADGSGVCYSSRLRPIVNMRPGFHHADLATPHQFAADLHLIDWMETKQFNYDVLTDEILHLEGLPLLQRYRVIVTGTHPEYWSLEMLDALQAYLDQGGRLMYLGGNGFYWVTSFAPGRPHAVEIRRAEGIRAWEHRPGELYHNSSGQRGGLWRWRGRTPQALTGVGFSAQGFDTSSPYRRREDSYDPRAAFIFEGVDEEVIGDFESLVMNYGAAGFELDRLDFELGTPPHTLWLASSFGHSDSYQHVIEEVLMSNSMQGGTIEPRVRADMTYFEGPNDGAVFSTGAIAWCGALSYNNYDNNVSRITENVLRRFQT